jgi:predicted PurR-regulated permease PerM
MSSPAPKHSPHRDSGEQSQPKPMVKPTGAPLDKTYVTAAIAVIGLFIFLYLIRIILMPFVIAGILAYICTPLVEWLNRRLRLPRLAAVSLVFVALGGLAGGIGFLAVPPLLRELTGIASNFESVLTLLVQRLVGNGTVPVLGQTMNAAQIANTVTSGLRDFLQQNGRVLLFASEGIAAFFAFFLGWVLLFYFLADGPRVGRGLFWLIPPSQRPVTNRVWPVLDSILRRYFVGIALVVLYASIASYIGLGVFLHLNHAVVLAILTGLLETIPVVGPAASAIIAGFVALNHATAFSNIIAFGFYLAALRISIDQVLGPYILGTAARIPPVLVIFCFLSGAILFGIAGVILAVPVALTVKVFLEAVYHDPLG